MFSHSSTEIDIWTSTKPQVDSIISLLYRMVAAKGAIGAQVAIPISKDIDILLFCGKTQFSPVNATPNPQLFAEY